MDTIRRAFIATALTATHTSAQIGSVCPTSDVCFKLNIPESTASSGQGDIFFQLSGPSSYEWIALGQGSGMVGANIFAIYTSADGKNVTLSPRTASGYTPPRLNEGAEVTLLEGSGVSNGKMTANVKCKSSNCWSHDSADFKATTGNWIFGVQSSGGPKNSNDRNAQIQQHSNAQPFNWNYANAKGGISVNPLLNAAPGGGQGGSATTSCVPRGAAMSRRRNMLIAHGTLAALAFVILFPTGGILIRLASFPGLWWIHGAFQIFAYLTYTAAFGLGVYIANQMELRGAAHPIIGIVVFIVLLFMPVFGYVHHVMYKKVGRRTWWSQVHIWVSRSAITLGIVNGGLGLRLADSMNMSSKPGIIAYGVVAGVMWLAWVVAAIVGEMRRKSARGAASPKDSDASRTDTETRGIPYPENGHYAPR
ncbi:iron reductase domain protein [Sporormia fimetaria CBS 119925]|uniref:Iron reductase domain protein n=1 Tax=Sporormia fimetaria CBS 119925 TaxID=1340428 RepID=A0A6A6VC22_9PLEO|nr:iron reductase domain protein [Sporormia fimetaria CBS 119925]